MKWMWEITEANQIYFHEDKEWIELKKKGTEENIWALEGRGDGWNGEDYITRNFKIYNLQQKLFE